MKKFSMVATAALCASVMAVSAAAATGGECNLGSGNAGGCYSNSGRYAVSQRLAAMGCPDSVLSMIFGNGQITLPGAGGSCGNNSCEGGADNSCGNDSCTGNSGSDNSCGNGWLGGFGSQNNGSQNNGGSTQQPETPSQPEAPSAPSQSVSAYEQKVVELVNEQRAKNGLSALKLNTEVSNVARAKSQDMRDKGYFSHTSPTYGSPFDMLKSFGISYSAAGENIAMGYATPEAVVTGWMNSSGHRANILSKSFTQIGVGYVVDGNYWTQMFIG